jgi:hypothetical protein
MMLHAYMFLQAVIILSVSHTGYKVQTLHGLLQSMVPCLLYALSGGNNCKNLWFKNISGTRDISVTKILDPAKHIYGH